MPFCPRCGNSHGENSNFCEQCGANLGKGGLICPACSSRNPTSSLFCNQCGNGLENGQGISRDRSEAVSQLEQASASPRPKPAPAHLPEWLFLCATEPSSSPESGTEAGTAAGSIPNWLDSPELGGAPHDPQGKDRELPEPPTDAPASEENIES